MHSKNDHGAITVYLSIILSAVIMLSGVLIDIIRIKAAEIQVRRAVNTAAISALACYNTKLKEDYGLFALHSSDSSYLSGTAEDYLAKNLLADISDTTDKHQIYNFLKGMIINNKYKDVDFIDLYDYKIQSIEVTPIYNYTENEVTERQILEYMKYRAPVQFAEKFLEKIDYAASAGELTSFYKQKTAIEKELGSIEKAMKRLQENIEDINKFEKGNFDSSPGSNSQLLMNIKNTVLKEIYFTCKGVDFGDLEGTEEEQAADCMREMDRLYVETAGQLENGIYLLNAQIRSCLNGIKGGIQELENINMLSVQVRKDVDNLRSSLRDIKSQNNSRQVESADIIAAMQKDIDKYEKLLDADHSQNILVDLKKDFEVLNQISAGISELFYWVPAETRDISTSALNQLKNTFGEDAEVDIIDQSQFDELISKLTANSKIKSIFEAANSYEMINNIMDKNKVFKGIDPRRGAAEAVKKVRKEIQVATSNPKKIENSMVLPSYFRNGSYPNKIYSEELLEEEEASNRDSAVVEQFNADFNEDSTFVDEGLDYIINFAKTLKDKAIDMRDEIYINEYILTIFKDAVEIDASNTDGKSKSTFFEKGEVEYIIGGNENEEINKYLVKGQILLIRFGMNTLHIYSDAAKRLQALELATAIAGFTGFGIPITQNLIMCAWGMTEAVSDSKDIYAGKKVPFIKTSENWRTELLSSGFNTKGTVDGNGELMDFDYHDYLRLLLLVRDKDANMNRIEDLIQLNTQQQNANFKLNSCNTYVKIDASVSIKYCFITKLFIPAKDKTIDGSRHVINVEVWRGY